ncbi:hypothetical protein [uncultured Roseobacter sp.]|uniref:hypothetical protein n=1 Tax=uncultured Roseobacter sp. TaxID=114847 RepID=UPI002637DEC0|nr:hypothetical protein [uncultured Roseobacter sp.]
MGIQKFTGPNELLTLDLSIVVHHHRPKAGVTLEQVTDAAYWQRVRRSLREGHRIEVFAEDGSYWAMLLVTGWASTGVEVYPLQTAEIASAFGGEDTDFKLIPQGATWKVQDTHTDETIHGGFTSKQAGAEWLAKNIAALRREARANDPTRFAEAG